jgi:hypothetical protein
MANHLAGSASGSAHRRSEASPNRISYLKPRTLEYRVRAATSLSEERRSMKKGIIAVFAALALFTAGLFAADVTGKWTAETEGRDGQKRVLTFDLKADGEKLTGTVNSQRGERPIIEGKVSGDEVSFAVEMEFNGEKRKIPYTGKIVGSEMKMKSGSGERIREFTAKRATS